MELKIVTTKTTHTYNVEENSPEFFQLVESLYTDFGYTQPFTYKGEVLVGVWVNGVEVNDDTVEDIVLV